MTKKALAKQSILGILVFLTVTGRAQTITTVAGNGGSGYGGDGGAAVSAQFNMPWDVDLDGSGNMYIADWGNNLVRKVSASGIVSTFAGGSGGYSGDGGPATAAALSGPIGVCAKGGYLFIADKTNYCVRQVDLSSGIISTFAGTGGSPGYSGDGGPATAAQLSSFNSMAVDGSGNMFIAEESNNCIRKVNTSGIITTVAGGAGVGFSGDGGAATAAKLHTPIDIAVDGYGNLYITDQLNNRVRKVSASGIITTFAGTGTAGYSGDGGRATAARLSYPDHVCVDGAGNVYISELNNVVVRKVSTSGIITTYAGSYSTGFSGDGGPATAAEFDLAVGINCDGAGNLYIADHHNSRIRKVTSSGSTLGITSGVPTTSAGISVFPNPTANIAHLFAEGGTIMDKVVVYDAVGREVCSINPGTASAELDMTRLATGNYIAHIFCGTKRHEVKLAKE